MKLKLHCAAKFRAVSALLLTIFMFCLPAASVRAQQMDLNQEMQLFNSLPPDQQQAILQRLGQGGGTMGGMGSSLGGLGGMGGLGLGSLGGLTGFNSAQSVLLQQQMFQQLRRQQAQQEDFLDKYGPPTFKAGDTVLVEIALMGESNLAELNAEQSAAQSGSPNAANAPGGQGASANQFSQLTPQQQLILRQQLAQQLSASNQHFQEHPQQPIEELQADERQRLEDLVELIRSHNPYKLDSDGQLLLPGIPPIALAGLTEDLATRRAAAEPAFARLDVRLTKLPLRKTGDEGLKPFGYDLFDEAAPLYAQMIQNAPVPADYALGPGDTLNVQLFGNENQTLKLPVSRDGVINFPRLGPIEVGGRRFSEVKEEIEARVPKQIVGVHASVAVGDPRAINVFVLGEVQYPGTYAVTGLATVTTALFAAGGIKERGSLRRIQLKRQGQLVRDVDLYDLLMRGDSANDAKLLPGDVVFVPTVGPTAAVSGEVMRPAIYELKGGGTIADLIQMGGGLTPRADRQNAALVRIDPQQHRVVVNINPSSPALSEQPLRNGDELQVLRLRPQLDSGVTLKGYVYRPKYAAWHQGLKLTDVIGSIDELKPNADENYLLIRRELPPNRRIVVLSADLAAALRAPGSAADVPLMPRDVIQVFDLETSRESVIQPLMDELRVQSNLTQPVQIVHVDGRVKVPGDYPLEDGMRVSDLIRAGGNLDSAAYGMHAELSRYVVQNGEQRRTEVLPVDLAAIRAGSADADLKLQPFDRLSIKQISGWTEQDQVTLRGEVRFPGTYTIKPGETLRSVVERAGGLTSQAFPAGSVFTRAELKKREQEQLDRFAERMRMDIAEEALEAARGNNAGSTAALSIGQTLLQQIKSAKAVGRLVIDLPRAMRAKPGSPDDIILRNGDELIVPKQRQEVMVIGEVQYQTSHLFRRNMTRDDYIAQSGGVTRQADRRQIYVVRADGSVESGRRGWFTSSDDVQMRPGDAIVVPLDTQKLPTLVLWQAITTILYNIAIATAEAHAL